jgi:hypothetical protein
MTHQSQPSDGAATVAEYEGIRVTSDMTGGAQPDVIAKEIYNALADRRWDFRTIHGLEQEIGQPVEVVRAVLEGNRGESVRVSLLTSPNGELLYTLAARPPSPRERAAEVQALVTF